MTTATRSTPEARAAKRVKDRTDVMWHVATYLIVNVFLWILDITTDGGVGWAVAINLIWGSGLIFHVASYYIDDSRQGKRYEKFLDDERRKEGIPD